ncbi:glycoside hydrolase family 31 protein [Cellvibrio sp. OA-2007]|uniref:glycoside hydrolase family 31 protein n=1 Tax=Cellvibrio sp. OA-2007 TaxID=529823 RepID=UPI000A936EEF|nr:TIM-barrel domain-containing protein [Cellvibrio sp. OA-2007]
MLFALKRLSSKAMITFCLIGVAAIALLQGCSKQSGSESSAENSAPAKQMEYAPEVDVTPDGVVLTLHDGRVKKVRLQVISEKIIRVTALPGDDFSVLPESIQVVANAVGKVPFSTEQDKESLILKTTQLAAELSLKYGTVKFRNAKGEVLLKEENRGSFTEVTADPIKPDADSFAIRQEFNRGTDEGFFGLGQHQNGQVNYAGENVELTTYNLVISIPFVVSSRDYGVLWDNNSVTRFGDPRETQPLNASLKLFDAEGKEGGMTARYYDGDKLLLTRVEADLNYQFFSNNSVREFPFPDEVKDAKDLRIEWEGSIQSDEPGTHHFKMYNSGYAKLYVDGQLALDRWRLNWNPWYHTYNMDMKAGEKKAIKVDWTVSGGFFRLTHLDPLPVEEQGELSLASDTGKAIDYYFVVGDNKDDVVAGYRHLTGKAVMLPKWVYGFWQSRERYKNQDEIVNTFKYYREKKIPIDNIVLDWSYWPENAWGSHDFDKKHFPDPKAMTDKIHAMNGNIMISVWPKFYPTTETYKELNDKGYMFNKNIEEGNVDWIGKGYPNAFYDPYPKEAQEIFWKQLNEKIKSKGFDAWWLDAAEPDIHSNLSFTKRKELMSREGGIASGAENFNSYAIPNATAVYNGERETSPEKRSFILTRSGFGGIQRTGSAIWSGDTSSDWDNLKDQVAAGVSTGIAGMPNWSFDIGGFTPEDKYRWGHKTGGEVFNIRDLKPELVADWQELNVRWFQFGAFVPLFRSHGQYPYREIFSLADEGTEVYNTLENYIKLRYRLMPYIYTLAGDTYHKDGTIMRPLVMDFPEDKNGWNINTQYMFGPSILVNPVYKNKARSREIYLPAGSDWYNFYTGEKLSGGQTITAAAPLSQMPLFVKAGAIIPTGAAIQHVDEGLNTPLTLNIYTGANGSFEIYEDDGRSTKYEQGEWARIPVSYDDATGTVTIGDRIGSFTGMANERSISVRFISGASKDAANFDAGVQGTITYSGKAVTIKMEK